MNLGIQWHVPNADERAFVFEVLDLLLKPELQRLESYAQGEQGMSRSEVTSHSNPNPNPVTLTHTHTQ